MSSVTAPQIICVASSSVPYTPFEALWVPNAARFVVLGENPRRTGNISVYQLDFGDNDNSDEKGMDGDNKPQRKKKDESAIKLSLRETTSHGFKCGTFGQCYSNTKNNECSQQLATGNIAGTLNIWDLEKLKQPVFEVQAAHQKIINCIDGISGFNAGAAEIVTGSGDGIVKLWDPRTSKAVLEMKPSSVNEQRDCWSVCFANSYNAQNRMIAAGYDNGDCKILDLRTNKIFFETNVLNGICCIEFDRKNTKLNKMIIASLQSQFRVYDMKTKHISEGFAYSNVDVLGKSSGNVVSQQNGNKGTTVWKCKHLPQNRDVWVSCLGNGSVNMYKYTYPDERFVIDDKGNKKGVMGQVELLTQNNVHSKLSTQPIVSWDWNRNKIGLACMSSLDQTIKLVAVTKLNKL